MKRLILTVPMAVAFAFATAAPLLAADAAKPAATSTLAETKDEYVKKAKVELDELSLKIDALEEKAKGAGTEARAGMNKQLKELKWRRKTVKRDFAKLKRATGKAWTDLKAGLDKGLADLKKELDEKN